MSTTKRFCESFLCVPMPFPNKLKFEALQSVHPDYSAALPFYELIDELVEGGDKLKANISKYLVKKPDEEDSVYAYRKKIFTYKPIITQAINQLCNKFSSGVHSVEGLPQAGAEGKFWREFRENTDLAGRSEVELLREVFLRAIKYRRVYALIDKPASDTPITNRYEEEKAGTNRPYVVLFNPCDVVHYQELDGRLQWLKLRRAENIYEILGGQKEYLVWTFITDQSVATYKAEVEKTAQGYQLKPRENETDEAGNQWVYLDSEVEHNLGYIPVTYCEIPMELWVTNQSVWLALEHIRVHNNLSYAANVAGQIQRLFKPIQSGADSQVDLDESNLKPGNESVLIGESFQFNETTGVAVNTVSSYLKNLEAALKDLIFSNGVGNDSSSSTPRESGKARAYDFLNQESALIRYGAKIAEFLESVYELVGKSYGLPAERIKTINVSGLTSFTLDSVDSRIERVAKLESLSVPLSNTVIKLVVTDLQKSLAPHASTEELGVIQTETKENFTPDEGLDLSFEDALTLVNLQALSVDTLLEDLGIDATDERAKVIEQMQIMQAAMVPPDPMTPDKLMEDLAKDAEPPSE